jgi:hypothetical protein
LKNDENHSRGGFNFHPVFNPLNQLLGAVLDFGFWIADGLYRWGRTLNPNSKI